MAMGVVDPLEMIDVQKHKRERQFMPAAALYLRFGGVKESPRVRKPGQVVGGREFQEFGLGRPQIDVKAFVVEDHIIERPDDGKDDKDHEKDRLDPIRLEELVKPRIGIGRDRTDDHQESKYQMAVADKRINDGPPLPRCSEKNAEAKNGEDEGRPGGDVDPGEYVRINVSEGKDARHRDRHHQKRSSVVVLKPDEAAVSFIGKCHRPDGQKIAEQYRNQIRGKTPEPDEQESESSGEV